MARKTKDQALATREAILDAAEVLFLKVGVAASTLDAVARSAGVTRGAVYWHFRNKEDLLLALRERLDQWLAEDITPTVAEGPNSELADIRQRCLRVLERMEQDLRFRRIVLILLTRKDFSEAAREGFERLLERDGQQLDEVAGQLARAQARGDIRPDITPQQAALGLFAMMQGILLSWLNTPANFAHGGEASRLLDIYLQGLLSVR